ncbi:MAG: ArnT family glycosyltransferase, partial [Shewanella sp.]
GLVDFKEQFILFSPMSVTHFSYLAPLAEQERNAWQWMKEIEQEQSKDREKGKASERDSEKQTRYLLVPSRAKLQCFNIQDGKTMGIAHREEWLLLSAKALTPKCEPPKRQYRYFTDHPGRWLN